MSGAKEGLRSCFWWRQNVTFYTLHAFSLLICRNSTALPLAGAPFTSGGLPAAAAGTSLCSAWAASAAA